MPHLKTPRENFDWRNVDFIWLNSPHYIKNDGHANKAINMPDHVDLINIHWIQKFQWPYRNQDVGFRFRSFARRTKISKR